MKQYLIEESALRELLEDSCRYSALKNGNVSTWIGYELANREYLCGLNWNDIVEVRLSSFPEYTED
jgi:hypothetical protein